MFVSWLDETADQLVTARQSENKQNMTTATATERVDGSTMGGAMERFVTAPFRRHVAAAVLVFATICGEREPAASLSYPISLACFLPGFSRVRRRHLPRLARFGLGHLLVGGFCSCVCVSAYPSGCLFGVSSLVPGSTTEVSTSHGE